MFDKSKIKISTNRNFGITFFVVFIIVGLWPLLDGENVRIWSFLIALFFLFLGLLNSKILTPLNIIWFKFGLFLGSIFAPIAMGIVFFIVVTPIGLFMRLLGKDLLNKKFNKNIKSYWINRGKISGTMKNQF